MLSELHKVAPIVITIQIDVHLTILNTFLIFYIESNAKLIFIVSIILNKTIQNSFYNHKRILFLFLQKQNICFAGNNTNVLFKKKSTQKDAFFYLLIIFFLNLAL